METPPSDSERSTIDMKLFCKTHSHLIISAFAFAFTAIVALLLLQSSAPDVRIGHLSDSITSSSPLSKQEENRRRWENRLSDAVDQVVAWRRRDDRSDEQLQGLEEGLASARAFIREALVVQNDGVSTPSVSPQLQPVSAMYPPAVFTRMPLPTTGKNQWSYLLMEKMFKIFVYEEGEPPMFHDGPCKSIYSIEGLFINLMEKDARFRTRDPNRALAFFLPFSVAMILDHLFDPIIRDKGVLERVVVDYVHTISTKYHYWNRSIGVDHFMLACHDWGPRATWYHPILYFHSIRVLCNANTSEYFNPEKDASIPDINFPMGVIGGFLRAETLSASNRSILAFFAGRMHGRIRHALFHHWKENDQQLRVYEHLPEGVSYDAMMGSNKYCICPSGFEVASPRIVEAIYAECVPVLISQDYVLPFSDMLDWDSFSVRVRVEEIPDLKRILMGISEERYLRMYENVKQVQRHFVVNDPPKRFDVFHMIVHSIWLRRLNVRINGG